MTVSSHYSLSAEQSVLAALIVDNDCWSEVGQLLSANDFCEERHRIIFDSIAALSLRSKPFDIPSLEEDIKRRDHEREKDEKQKRRQPVSLLDIVGGVPYLFEITAASPSAERAVYHARIVREYAILRSLIDTGKRICELGELRGDREISEVIDDAERAVYEVSKLALSKHESFATPPSTLDQIERETYERAERFKDGSDGIIGMPTGFTELDRITLGLQKNALYVLAARPSVGKTALAINIATNIARGAQGWQPASVAVFSMEMTANELLRRVIAAEGKVSHKRLQTGMLEGQEEKSRFTNTLATLRIMPLYIDESGQLNPNELRSRCRRLQRDLSRKGERLGLVVIDYIQLMHVPWLQENRVAEVTYITRALKQLAKEAETPILALSQLNREFEKRGDESRTPRLSDLRDSGSIEQDADVVMFIERPLRSAEQANGAKVRSGMGGQLPPEPTRPYIHIAKNRHGETGKFPLCFVGEHMRFYNEEERRDVLIERPVTTYGGYVGGNDDPFGDESDRAARILGNKR